MEKKLVLIPDHPLRRSRYTYYVVHIHQVAEIKGNLLF